MYAEREELVKRIFPQLRDLCERRRVTLSEIDLRWGIPQEDVNADRVLPICLDEVTNCRPFFIALVGDRYGTTVSKIPDELLKREPWLGDQIGTSISELEILHGALNNRNAPVHAFFYLRNSKPEAVTVDSESRRKTESLKERIRNSGFPVRDYTTPSQVGELVLDDLKMLFTTIFPEESLPNAFQQKEAEHEAFAESRSFVYIGNQTYFDQLDEHLESQRPPMIVTGETGAGKSSLLANWVRRRLGQSIQLEPAALPNRVRGKLRNLIRTFVSTNAPDALLLAHFVGASSTSADRSAMLRRFLEVLRQRFALPLNIPEQPGKLPLAFANCLQASAERGKIILILDGIDELSNDVLTNDFTWLPTEIPTNIRIILSVTEGTALDELRKRGWPVLKIKPLPPTEREILVTNYFAQYRKKLDQPLIRQISSGKYTANPLYLRTVLGELRLFGGQNYELSRLVQHLLTASNTNDLFGILLDRLEQDYSAPDWPELVRNTMQLLWASRDGLSESELADLLGTSDGPLSSALWSPLYLAIKELMINRSGLLSFFHAAFRQAVEKRCFSDGNHKLNAHRQLVDYFRRYGSQHRRMAELPWQLAALSDWSELSSLLSASEFLSKAWAVNQFDVKSYWAMIEARSPIRMVNTYAPVIKSPERNKECLPALCALLTDGGYVREALTVGDYLEKAARESGNISALQASLSTRATLLKRLGDLDDALVLLKEQEELCRNAENWAALASSLGNQAVILLEMGKPGEALAVNKQEEAICRRIEDLAGLSASLGNQGIILKELGDPAGALNLLREQEKVCRQLGDLAGLQKSLGNQGLLYHSQGESSKGLKLLKEDESLCRRLGDLASLHVCLGNQASILESMGDYDEALELYRQKETICQDIGDMMGLARSLWLQAYLFAEKLRQPNFALPLAQKAWQIASENHLTSMTRDIEKLMLQLSK
jgi:nephrocystin-3